MRLTISQLAKICEVNSNTVRYYERVGLIVPDQRSDAGYRIYNKMAIKRLRFVKRAQTLGFTLDEIKELLGLSEKPETDCADIRVVAQNKVKDIEQRINDLVRMKKSLQELAGFCPGEGKSLRECNILEYFYGGYDEIDD